MAAATCWRDVLVVGVAAAPEAVRAWVPSRESTWGHCIRHIVGQLLAQIDTVMNEGVEVTEYRDGTREVPLTQGWGATGMAYIPFAVGGVEEGQRGQNSADRPRNPRGQSPSRDVVVGVVLEVAEGNYTDSMALVP